MSDKRYLSKKDAGYREKLYNQGLDDGQIAKKTEIASGGIQAWRKRNNLQANKRQGGQAIELDFKLSWELGYLIGLTVGDGSVCRDGQGYQTRFASTRKDFIDLITKTINNLFPEICTTCCSFYRNDKGKFPSGHYRKPTINYAVSVSSKKLYYFMKKYKKENYIWLTPNEQPLIVKYGFIGGIIDAEGTVSRPCVAVFSKYEENLIRLEKLMKELGFIYGKLSIRKENCYALKIYGRRNHKMLLKNAKMPYKRKKLEKYFIKKSYYHDAEEYWKVMKLRKDGLGWRKISKETGLPLGTVSNWLYNGVMPLSLGLEKKYGESSQNE